MRYTLRIHFPLHKPFRIRLSLGFIGTGVIDPNLPWKKLISVRPAAESRFQYACATPTLAA
jgi:hypothetical protein